MAQRNENRATMKQEEKDLSYFSTRPIRPERTLPMAISFSNVPTNDVSLAGQNAAPQQLFGEHNRYAVAPVHTRVGRIMWFVWDAETPDVYDLGLPEIIRQEWTLEDAIKGLLP